MGNRFKFVHSTLMTSLAAHAGVGFLFLYSRTLSSPTVGRQGVVSVQIIQQSTHDQSNQPTTGPQVVNKKNDNKKTGSRTEVDDQPLDEQRSSQPLFSTLTVEQASYEYITQVTALVKSHKMYPEESVRREEEGKILVSITLDRDGNLLDSRVEEPCVFENLNQAALTSVRSFKKFPPVPEPLQVPLHLHIPLVYKIVSANNF